MTNAYVQTYDNLVADVINYMERNDAQFVAQIPSLIGLAESAIAAELKTYLQLTVVETTLLANEVILAKPARWRKTVSMKANGRPILMRSQDYIAQYQSESTAGAVKYYGEYDYNNWAFAPAPIANTAIEIIYYSEIQPLDSQNQQNLFTREAPQAMLFGTLLQAQGYLKALDKLPVWKGYYTDALAALKKEDNSRRIDRNVTTQEP
jgi:hypothetical protein